MRRRLAKKVDVTAWSRRGAVGPRRHESTWLRIPEWQYRSIEAIYSLRRCDCWIPYERPTRRKFEARYKAGRMLALPTGRLRLTRHEKPAKVQACV